MSFTPTQEQQDIREVFASGDTLVIEALAGTGKTTTLKMLAKDAPSTKMTYVAFNRAIADEARRSFPQNVTSSTMHSFAFRALGEKFRDRLNGPRVQAWQVVAALRITSRFTFGEFNLRDQQIARLVTESVNRFCHSADQVPSAHHVPRVPGMDTLQAHAELTRFLMPFIRRAWDDLQQPMGDLKFSHDVYLKLWSMGSPKLPGDVILFDEAQDGDPVIMHIVRQQMERGAKILPVGDAQQQIYCQPPGTLVSVSGGGSLKIEDVQVGDRVVAYKDRRVFLQGRRVSGVTRVPYARSLVRVTLPGGETSAYSDKHRCIVRFGEELRGKHAVYLMRREGAFRVGRTALFYDSVGGLFGPVARAKAERADALWVLSVHESAEDAALAEALVSLEFGVPDVCFERHGGAALDPARFWSAVRARGVTRNLSGAVGALLAHGRRVDEPFWKTGDRVGLRTPMITAACNVVDGMRMLPLTGTVTADRLSERKAPIQCWEPVSVSREEFSGELISLEVEDCHTYFADGVLTHNSWRGAVNALGAFDAQHRLPLQKCQPPGTMVRVPVEPARVLGGGRPQMSWKNVPIEEISTGDKVVSWNPKWGLIKRGRVVNDVSVAQYDGPLITASVGSYESKYAAHHDCVVVLGTLTEGDHVVYMMRRGDQYRIGRCPWRYASTGIGPIRRAVGEGADAMWVLSVHETAAEAALHEALAQTEFGIPGVGWKVFSGSRGYKMPLDMFWSKVGDNTSRADKCLNQHGLLINYPLWTREAKDSRPGAGWSTRVTTAAANLRDGMLMLTSNAAGSSNGSARGYTPWSAWTSIHVSREWYSGLVYSLSVETDHTYVADEIVTHNSFRFGPEVADRANLILEALGTDLRLEGHEPVGSRLAHLSDPDAVLCRTNAEAVAQLMLAQVAGLRAGLVGGTAAVEALAKAAQDLMSGRKTWHPELMAFDNWSQVQRYVEESKEEARDIAVLVKLVDRYGTDAILEAVRRAVPENEATLVISTAHKAKGREWERVRVASDFADFRDEESGEIVPGEARLQYVAVTRAQKFLDDSALPWVDELKYARDFEDTERVPSADVPPRPVVEAPVVLVLVETEQVICDPESTDMLIMCKTNYDPVLVDAQRGLAGRRYRSEYCGMERVNIVRATASALRVAEQFGLTVSAEAKQRVEDLGLA